MTHLWSDLKPCHIGSHVFCLDGGYCHRFLRRCQILPVTIALRNRETYYVSEEHIAAEMLMLNQLERPGSSRSGFGLVCVFDRETHKKIVQEGFKGLSVWFYSCVHGL